MTSLSTSNDAALPTSMRAAAIDGAGGPEALTVRTLPLPVQVSAEFLVRVVAAGVNPIDAKTRAGSGVFAGIAAFPYVLGNDFSGVVVRSPYDAHPIKVGDEVYGMMTVPRGSGSYAEYVSVPALQLARKPQGISHIQAAGVPIAALTAWGAVVQVGTVQEGQKVLIHAGAGGVGQRPGHVEGHACQAAQAAALQSWKKAHVRLFAAVLRGEGRLLPGVPVGCAVQAGSPGTPLFDPELSHAESSSRPLPRASLSTAIPPAGRVGRDHGEVLALSRPCAARANFGTFVLTGGRRSPLAALTPRP